MIIHPANAPCTLAAAAAAEAAVLAAAAEEGGEGAVLPSSGSVKKDQPPPVPGRPFRCCLAFGTGVIQEARERTQFTCE